MAKLNCVADCSVRSKRGCARPEEKTLSPHRQQETYRRRRWVGWGVAGAVLQVSGSVFRSAAMASSSNAFAAEGDGVVVQSRAEKVKAIFEQFDKNDDGRLSKDEMASLVVAVNPSVRFSEEQIAAILDEVRARISCTVCTILCVGTSPYLQ
jgi:hypothetical protein